MRHANARSRWCLLSTGRVTIVNMLASLWDLLVRYRRLRITSESTWKILLCLRTGVGGCNCNIFSAGFTKVGPVWHKLNVIRGPGPYFFSPSISAVRRWVSLVNNTLWTSACFVAFRKIFTIEKLGTTLRTSTVANRKENTFFQNVGP